VPVPPAVPVPPTVPVLLPGLVRVAGAVIAPEPVSLPEAGGALPLLLEALWQPAISAATPIKIMSLFI
jgi:hypothetical protein